MEKTKGKTAINATIIGLKLLLICAVIAAVIAFVYQLTIEKYEENLQRTKDQAISQIFGIEGARCEEVYTDAQSGAVVYLVFNEADPSFSAYCVETASAGFGGDVCVMVGYNDDRSIRGVSVVSMSETPGLGSKIGEAGYLRGYVGKKGELVPGRDVDVIAGATISSKALLVAVNQATDALEAKDANVTMGGAAE